MESLFDKYINDGQKTAEHIANINSYINYNYNIGRKLILEEIEDLSRRITNGDAPPIFSNKKDELVALGKAIEKIYETYHFNKDN